MSTHGNIITDLLPITPMEEVFRTIHNDGADKYARLDELPKSLRDGLSAQEQELCWLMVKSYRGISLYENMFFDMDSDIFINIHPRYCPLCIHRHNFFEIQFALNKVIVQDIDDEHVTLQPGDICFIAPETEHVPLVFDDETLILNILVRKSTFQDTFFNLLKRDDIISDFFMRVLYSQSYHPFLICQTGSDSQVFATALQMLELSTKSDYYSKKLLCLMLEQLFIYLLRDHSTSFFSGNPENKDDTRIVSILQYIQQNFKTVTLSRAADDFGYNKTYFSRIVKNSTGTSFTQLVKILKLQYAAGLLADSNMPISDIIIDCGYEDQTYFYRAFKGKYGSTPADYRKQHNCRI